MKLFIDKLKNHDSDIFILYSISLTYAEQSQNNFVIIWKIRRNHSCPYGFLCYKDKFFSQWRHQTENVPEG